MSAKLYQKSDGIIRQNEQRDILVERAYTSMKITPGRAL